jgi:hypothetical protein
MKRTKSTKQIEALKRLPSPLFTAALYRSGAGAHADQNGRYSKRQRSQNRAEERRARLEAA